MPDQVRIDRYRNLLLALMPPGRGISRSLDSDFADLFSRLAIEFARVEERAIDLRTEGVPATADEMLEDWEEALGLPTSCFTPTTLGERRAAVVARIVGTGGHSLADYTALAAALGYAAPTFTTYAPFRCGSRVGDRLTNGPWRSTAMVTIGTGFADTLIECAFRAQTMAHETLLFTFTDPRELRVLGRTLYVLGQPLFITRSA